MKIIALFSLILLLGSFCQSQGHPKIAIIGGGIGGTSLAHFLRHSMKDHVNLTIFSQNGIGGRLKTVNLAGETYECGGTIIHPSNRLMDELVSKMGLSHRRPGPNSRITLIGKQNKVLFQQTSFSFLQPLQFIYRYGLFSLMKLHYYIQNMLEQFSKIYDFLSEGLYCDNVEDLLKVMTPVARKGKGKDFLMNDLVQVSLSQELINQNLPLNLVDELVTAAVRTNYGQIPSSVHAFVGSVALAGAEGELWSIEGGNHLLAQKLFESSKALLIQSKVGKLSKSSQGWQIFSSQGQEHLGNFDIVILATPMTTDTQNLTIEGLQINFPGSYHRTVATLVEGQLNPAFVENGQPSNTNFIIDPTNNINSISLLAPVNSKDQGQNVWKVFSQQPLSEKEMESIFKSKTQTVICDWLAYPQYSTNQTKTLSKFKLDSNLYHINAIEWAASAMEMSVIGAKNVANIISQTLKNSNSVDYDTKNEL